MPIVVGISLRTAGKLYYFDPGTERYLHGEKVLVETARGQELGTVKLPPHEVADEQVVLPLKPIIRRATTADIARNSANREREEYALNVCKRHVERLKLPMRLIDAQYTLDCSHVLIHFLAENRVDFRELVRELARELHARIELRQVGVRDEAKLLGGYGICGRKLCCSAFLGDFTPVAISMAKDQGLALNPQKISGACGRLMCCLAFECDQYRTEKADLPRLNSMIETPQGVGKVTKLNVLSHQVEVSFADTAPIWFAMTDLAMKKPAAAGGGCCGDGAPSACGQCRGKAGTLAAASDGDAASPTDDDRTVAVATIGGPETAEHATRTRAKRRHKKTTADVRQGQGQLPAPLPQGGSEAAGEKPKRPRRRKPRAARTEGAPVPVAAEKPLPVNSGGEAKAPSGRYRPRRRRRPSSGGNAPQA